jgi:hypothetical protein
MEKREQIQKYDNPEFWSRVIKEAKKQAAPVHVKQVYRPIGLLVVLSFLVLTVFLDHGVPVPIAVTLTLLISLLTVVFS